MIALVCKRVWSTAEDGYWEVKAEKMMINLEVINILSQLIVFEFIWKHHFTAATVEKNHQRKIEVSA